MNNKKKEEKKRKETAWNKFFKYFTIFSVDFAVNWNVLVIVKSAYGQYQSFTSTISSAILLCKGCKKTVQVKILKKCLFPQLYIGVCISSTFLVHFMTLQQPIKSKENHYFLGMLEKNVTSLDTCSTHRKI